MKGKIQAFNNVAFKTLQRSKPKMFGKREGNGLVLQKWVSTPHILSMRSYVHTPAKHAKKEFLSKHAKLTL